MAISKITNKNYITEKGSNNGWSYVKYSDGSMRAERDINTGSDWTIVSSPIAQNTLSLTPPSNMSVKSGYANLNSQSDYIIGQNVQVNGSNIILKSFRLATSSATFSTHVTLLGGVLTKLFKALQTLTFRTERRCA